MFQIETFSCTTNPSDIFTGVNSSLSINDPVSAIDAATAAAEVVASEGGTQVLNEALKVARSKTALSVAVGITCIACLPVSSAVTSPGLCIACGILVAKTLG